MVTITLTQLLSNSTLLLIAIGPHLAFDVAQPYEYHASPAVLTTAPSPVATSPYVAPNGTTAGYGVPAGRNTAPGSHMPGVVSCCCAFSLQSGAVDVCMRWSAAARGVPAM